MPLKHARVVLLRYKLRVSQRQTVKSLVIPTNSVFPNPSVIPAQTGIQFVASAVPARRMMRFAWLTASYGLPLSTFPFLGDCNHLLLTPSHFLADTAGTVL